MGISERFKDKSDLVAALLRRDTAVVVWSDEQIFESGSYPLEVQEKEVNQADFADVVPYGAPALRAYNRRVRYSLFSCWLSAFLYPVE